MPERIVYTQSMVVDSGPSIVKNAAIEVEAYDVVDVVAPHGGSAVVDIQPGGAGQVQAIFISADSYEDLTLTVDAGTPATLDGPIMLIGAGSVALLGATQKVFTFANAHVSRDINIKVLVGRTAEQQGA